MYSLQMKGFKKLFVFSLFGSLITLEILKNTGPECMHIYHCGLCCFKMDFVCSSLFSFIL